MRDGKKRGGAGHWNVLGSVQPNANAYMYVPILSLLAKLMISAIRSSERFVHLLSLLELTLTD